MLLFIFLSAHILFGFHKNTTTCCQISRGVVVVSSRLLAGAPATCCRGVRFNFWPICLFSPYAPVGPAKSGHLAESERLLPSRFCCWPSILAQMWLLERKTGRGTLDLSPSVWSRLASRPTISQSFLEVGLLLVGAINKSPLEARSGTGPLVAVISRATFWPIRLCLFS